MARTSLRIAAALAAGVALAAGAAWAQDPAPATPAAKAAAQRQDNFRQLAATMKGLGDQLKADAPDAKALAASGAKVNGLAQQLPTWFPKGSGVESQYKTNAKAEVWTDAAGFAAAAARLQAETAKLQALSAAGDVAGVKAQVRAVGGACKNCHDRYRAAAKG